MHLTRASNTIAVSPHTFSNGNQKYASLKRFRLVSTTRTKNGMAVLVFPSSQEVTIYLCPLHTLSILRNITRIEPLMETETIEEQVCIAHMCSLLFAHHQLSSAEQINHQSTYRPGVAEQHLLCWSSLLLQAHLTVAFVCLKSYSLYILKNTTQIEPLIETKTIEQQSHSDL